MDDDRHGVKSSELVVRCDSPESWPELLGVEAMQAVNVILQGRPDVVVEVDPLGTNVVPAPGENLKRVCVFINDLGIVAQIPIAG